MKFRVEMVVDVDDVVFSYLDDTFSKKEERAGRVLLRKINDLYTNVKDVKVHALARDKRQTGVTIHIG